MSAKRKQVDRISMIERHIDDVEAILNQAVAETPKPKAEQPPIMPAKAQKSASRSTVGLDPEQRARNWYPSAAWGGGNTDANFKGSGGRFLWKPVSDSTKKCAVHTPAGVRVSSITVAGKTYGVGSIGNGYRPLFRLDKPGSAYGKGIPVTLNLHGGGVLTIIVPDGSKRFEKSDFKDTDAAPATPPVQPSQPQPGPVGGSITFPPSYAARVAFVALVGASGEVCKPDPRKAGRWTHKRVAAPADFYAILWREKPPYYAKSFDYGPMGIWSYFDDGDFKSWPNAQVPVAPLPPAPVPLPPMPTPQRDATLTATGLRLAPDLVPLVAKVLILEYASTPSKTVKYPCRQSGAEWSSGSPLSFYRDAVYQIFWNQEPPKRIPHHQGFPGAIKNVSHVMPDGRWNPPSTRNP